MHYMTLGETQAAPTITDYLLSGLQSTASDASAEAEADSEGPPVSKVCWCSPPSKGGRIVCATDDILAGETIELSPVTPVAETDIANRGTPTALGKHLIPWRRTWGQEYAIGFGLLMLYNHSVQPNVHFVRNYAEREIAVVALRNIKRGEELVVDLRRPLW